MSKKIKKVTEYLPLISVIIIIIVIIILDIILGNYTKNSVAKMEDELNSINDLLDSVYEKEESPDYEIAYFKEKLDSQTKQLLDDWNEMQKKLSYYVEHDEIEKVSDKISLIKKQVEIDDFGDAGQAVTETKYLLKHIEEKQVLNLKNIF